eukprot:CAMPEP_0198142014 /NCGR_PEP_ID=MMETSP1443-20131203/4912_1 /TAXON_ID=186043 /ORGANISM="Entomoneis sp., Strain CCMP2396" /LENGTH=229 /DNA_ID=CAMNT_0043804933 /DNA_START=62 /DNA_END=751 /DNA_ORIENTATION=+
MPPEESNSDITPEASKRICKHMNEDHYITVLAMARSVAILKPGWKVSEARLLEADLWKFTLQAVTCSGAMCEMQKVDFPLHPPLNYSSEIRKRMVEIHNQLLQPKLYWLIKPQSVINLFLLTAMAYGELVLGIEGMESAIDGSKKYHHMATDTLVLVLRCVFWFTVCVHSIEGAYGFYHSRTTLKLKLPGQLMWGALLLIAGFPVMSEFTPLVQAALAHQQEEATKKQA